MSNTSTLAVAELSTISFLYATDGNGTRRWLVGSNSDGAAITTTTTAPGTARWRNNDNRLYWNQTNNYYAYYRENIWRTSRRNNGDYYGVNAFRSGNNRGTDFRSTTYTCTTTSQGPTDNTISPTISVASNTSNSITFNHTDLTGTYVPQYTRYAFNNTTHNWYNDTDYGNTEPSVDANTLSPTYTWSLTANGGGVATINASTGVLTLSGAPTGNITVRLTVSNISPLTNKTVDFTLTRGTAAQTTNTVSTINSLSVSPSSAALYVSESQAFTASATVNNTTYTTPAHTTLTGGGNTYHYYNGTLYTNTEDFSSSNSTTATPTYAWSMTGAGSGNASLSATSGANTTLTHTPGVDADKALTLTVEASYTGATPQTRSMQVNLYAPFVAPTITRSGNNISLSIASLGATIYYTTDGSTPSTSNGTVYTGPFSLEELSLPVTVKAIAVRNAESTTVAQQTYNTLSLEKPVISISPAGAVTITCASAGATIRYTTDGTNPTSSSGTVYSGTFNVANLTTVKAIAYKAGYDDSEVASETYITSGINGNVVILNDYEDHSWSYYQPLSALPDGYPKRLCSPYPRNVKITYYGYGNNTLSTEDDPSPAASTFSTNTTSSQVKVGIGEEGHTFVYYKTLERDAANGRYPYELIPNPFYVRPKSGGTYTGFYKWRVKSVTGGSIYDVASGGTAIATTSTTSTNNVWLDAETIYYFDPADNGETNVNNATSMTVELEAIWAAAEISTGNTPSFSKGYNSVERNFYVGSGGLFSSNTPCTYSSFYPNGTTDGTTEATIAANGTVNGRQTKASGTAIADCKVEYMLLTGNTTADAYNLTLGRGIGIGTAGYFYPVNATKNTDVDFRLRIESGVYSRLYLMSDGDRSYKRIQNHFTIGSDYDRAKGDNSKLTVAQGDIIKNGNSEFSDANKDKPTLTCIIKSGEFQSNYWYNNNNAQYNYGFYCCQDHDNASYPGLTTLIVEGGHFASIIGGRGNYTVGCITQDSLAFDLRFKGGLVENSIYGASSNNQTYGSRRLIFTGGEVRGWIAAGCNGTSSDNRGQTNGDSYVYVGGNTKVGNADNIRTNNSAVGGNVFGAGRGMASQRASIKTSNVAVADNAEVLHDVFGGGFHGYITTISNIFILGGTTHGRIFGGGDDHGDVSADVTRRIPIVNIHMTGGVVEGGIYGGSNTTGIVTDLANVHIDGGQVGVSGTPANIHGGGLGESTVVSGNVSVTLGASTLAADSATVYGNVYGGSALGSVNTNSGNTTTVTMNKALINGNLFGGALGQESPYIAAPVNGLITVNIKGGRVNGNVYGGGNIAPYSPSSDYPKVNMSGGRATNVFGGGKGSTATITGNPQVILSGNAHVDVNVYGGGDAAQVTGNSSVTIQN